MINCDKNAPQSMKHTSVCFDKIEKGLYPLLLHVI